MDREPIPPHAEVCWIFLDLGNILWDEDPLTYFSFRSHVEAVRRDRPDLAFAELLAARESRVRDGSRWPVYEVVARYLDESACSALWETTSAAARARFAELTPAIPGAVELIDDLSRRFLLGVIANQPREARGRLAELGLLARFEVVVLGEEEGLYKPDPRAFLRGIERAGARPEQCLMVGDRLDDDIAPAAALGMATAWVRWPDRAVKGWRPDDPDAAAYLRSLDRCAASTTDRRAGPGPTIVVDEVGDLGGAIDAACGFLSVVPITGRPR